MMFLRHPPLNEVFWIYRIYFSGIKIANRRDSNEWQNLYNANLRNFVPEKFA